MILGKVRAKNFFSIGNAFLEIDIQAYRRAVFIGANGNGKSTIANIISFVFFGKTIKNVTKAQIVNSINGKACVAEGEFTDAGDSYLVRRGIKPNIFEIYKNGELIDQSSVVDYQTFLEEKIMKCTYRTFLQTSIISIENYQPFMSLPKAGRRDFIEDILDIKVFSVMNQLTKTKVNKIKDELRIIDVKISAYREKITIQKTHIEKIEKMKTVELSSIDTKLSEYLQELESTNAILESVISTKPALDETSINLRASKTERDELMRAIDVVKNSIKTLEKELVFFETNDDCPSCRQGISHEHVAGIREVHNEKHRELIEKRDSLSTKLEVYLSLDDDFAKYQNDLSEYNSSVSVCNATITRLNRLIKELNEQKNSVVNSVDVGEQKLEMKETAKEALKLSKRQSELNDDLNYTTVMLELFKDSGAKSKIVEQYIPVINKLVNEYLDKFEFFVSFNLDAEFNETIKSRHRDDFTYASFSAGERMKIDLSLLFTFRRLAKMRNSFSTNLLICDEIFDASADAATIESLLTLLHSEEFNDTNMLVISHSNKDRFENSFDGLYEVYKRDGFTQVKE